MLFRCKSHDFFYDGFDGLSVSATAEHLVAVRRFRECNQQVGRVQFRVV